MGRTNKLDLDNRLDAHFATLRSSGVASALKRNAGNWQIYAAVTGSALAMATSASAGAIGYGGPSITASISSVGSLHSTHGGSTAEIEHHSNKTAFLTGAPAGVGFSIGVSQACCGDNALEGAAFAKGLGGLEFFAASSFLLRKFASGAAVSGAAGAVKTNQLFLDTAEEIFTSHLSAHNGQWTAGKTAYAGFRFQTAGSKTDYGWVRLVFTDSANTMPDSITAIGEVNPSPEPSTGALALLAAGAAGVAALRRRGKAAA